MARRQTPPVNQPHWLRDVFGNGYYIPPTTGTLNVVRHSQQWLYMYKKYLKPGAVSPILSYFGRKYRHPRMQDNEQYFNPTTGDYALAYVDHGVQPKAAAIQYTVVVDIAAAAMARFAAAMGGPETAPYTVIRDRGDAHIVYDRDSMTFGAVFFAATEALPEASPITAVSRDCFVMLQQRENVLNLSIAVGKVTAGMEPLQLTLRGRWRATAETAATAAPTMTTMTTTATTTTLALTPADYLPIRLKLTALE